MDINSLMTGLGITPAEFVVQLIGFIILIFVMKALLYKPISGILDQRAADIKETYDQLDADREAMHKTRAEYEQRLANIEAEGREKIQAAVKEAQELRASIIEEARQKADAAIQAGLAELEREKTRALVELRGQVADLAIGAATKVVGASVDDAKQRALVDEFIASVGAEPLTSSAKKATTNGAGAKN